jgi:hypothetical protein
MERTTIYLDDELKRSILELSQEETRKKGKRIGMAEIIREAMVEYLQKKGMDLEGPEAVVNRMLSTRGALGGDFEKRVKEVRQELRKWKI